ncbi:MAG: hypothetical protein J6M92_03270 [Oribacterium sp.]|nr:hypothetical protein [Oribacterium sp.]
MSWDYLQYVRNNPVEWSAPTDILYGSLDNLQDIDTITAFAKKTGATLTVMEGGEHWFHTDKQMDYLRKWILTHTSNE